MYESFFHLKRRPFAATPDGRCFLSAGPIQGALDELVICIEQGQGIAVVSAPAGTGKTLLCERLRLELDTRFEMVLLRHTSFLTRRGVLQTILCDLNHIYQHHDEQELRLELIPAIRALNPRREALVLICDEAHQLSEELLEELRILSDLAEQGRPLVRLVLVGQPSLEETLASPHLAALNQRIRAHICLNEFDRRLSRDYVDYRITWGGGRTEDIFTSDALDLICHASEGVPRRINQLCDHTLLLAYVAEQRPVAPDTVREALHDLRQLPLHWNESLTRDSSDDPIEDDSPVESHSVESHESAATASEMESVEFGVDLPDSPVQEVTTLAPAALAIEIEAVDETPDVEEEPLAEESRQVEFDDEPDVSTQSSIMKSPLFRLMKAFPQAQLPTQAERPSAPPSSDLVEELVLDKYAAIDGGFSLPETPAIPTPVHRIPETDQMDVVSHDTATVVQVPVEPEKIEETAEVHPESAVKSSMEVSEWSSANVESADDIEFEAACDRLSCWLPQQISGAPPANEVTVPEDIESDKFDSLEMDLVLSARELADHVRSEIEVSDDSESLDERLRQVMEPEVVETMAPTHEPVAASVPKSDSQPFRNLFSRLRRKQQGLL